MLSLIGSKLEHGELGERDCEPTFPVGGSPSLTLLPFSAERQQTNDLDDERVVRGAIRRWKTRMAQLKVRTTAHSRYGWC